MFSNMTMNVWTIIEWLHNPFSTIISAQLIKIVFLLVAVAYFTLAERKVMAAIQRRKGPNVVGVWGLLQPIADGAKLVFKELLIPTRSDSYIFLIAPILILVLSMINWSIIPTNIDVATPTFSYLKKFTSLFRWIINKYLY